MNENPTAGKIKRAKKDRQLSHAWSLTDGRCVYCNCETPVIFRTVDHCVPRSHGGGATSTNLLPACYHCNNARGITSPASRLAHPRWKSLVMQFEASLKTP